MPGTKPKTDRELREIAMAMYSGTIFSTLLVREDEDFTDIFFALKFLSAEDKRKLVEQEIGLFYEYISEAAPMSINGRPVFFSVRMLSKAETYRLWPMLKKLYNFVEGKEEKKDLPARMAEEVDAHDLKSCDPE